MPTCHHGFAPIADQNSRVLILGTFPGRVSRENNEYYSNPRNQFWKILAELSGEKTVPTNYTKKIQILQSQEIALWDMIFSCETDGSLDSEIKNERIIDLLAFLSAFPRIKLILFNGQNAAKYTKKLENISVPTIILPSTSPANATKSYAEKLKIWKSALETTIKLNPVT